MVTRRGRFVQFSLLGLIVLGFLAAGAYLLVQQHTGDRVTATVTSCEERRRSETCQGTWVVRGAAHEGVVEGASLDDLGDTVEARGHGDRAYVPNARVPAVLIGIGMLLPVTALVTWVKGRLDRPARRVGVG